MELQKSSAESDMYLNLQLHYILANQPWGHVVWISEIACARHLVSSEKILIYYLFTSSIGLNKLPLRVCPAVSAEV